MCDMPARGRWLIPGVGLALSVAATAQAPAPRVLVVPFAVQSTAASPAPWVGEAAALLVADALDARGIAVVTRDVRAAAFDRLELPLTVPLTRATVLRVGELVGASEIVFGEVEVNEGLTVRARVVRLASASEVVASPESGPMAELMPLFERVGGQVATALGRGSAPAADRLPKTPLDAFENYSKALVAVAPAVQQRLLETAVKLAPRDGRILTALAAVYAAEGEPAKALGAAVAVPADSPFSRKARFLAAMALIDLGRLDGAFRGLSTLDTEKPAAVLENAIGVVQLRRGSPTGTDPPTVYFKHAVDLEPANTDYLFNLGYAYALARDRPSALSWLREAVRHDATIGDAHLVMSAVLSADGRTAEASREMDLAKLLGTRPDIATLAVTDRIPAKLERLPTTLDVAPLMRLQAAIAAPDARAHEETATFYLDQGRTLAGLGRDREAVAALQRAIYLSPYDDEPHVILGRLYARGGRSSDATDEFKVAIWCRETPAARLGLARAYLDAGDAVAARREAERALALDPNSAEAKALLKKIDGGAMLTSPQPHG
jgi:tetratricopeptide (TPR) repeat protein